MKTLFGHILSEDTEVTVSYDQLRVTHGYDRMDPEQIKMSLDTYRAQGVTIVGVPIGANFNINDLK